jgi:hypothetical protein
MLEIFQTILEKLSHEKFRIHYILSFCFLIIIAIVVTLCIYYFVRHKKKYYFEAAGR